MRGGSIEFVFNRNFREDVKFSFGDIMYVSMCNPIDEVEFSLKTDEELDYLYRQLDIISNPNNPLCMRKDIAKNYLFVDLDSDIFVYIENAYPIEINIPYHNMILDSICKMGFISYIRDEIDTITYPFLKPYIRKMRIKNLIKKKII